MPTTISVIISAIVTSTAGIGIEIRSTVIKIVQSELTNDGIPR